MPDRHRDPELRRETVDRVAVYRRVVAQQFDSQSSTALRLIVDTHRPDLGIAPEPAAADAQKKGPTANRWRAAADRDGDALGRLHALITIADRCFFLRSPSPVG